MPYLHNIKCYCDEKRDSVSSFPEGREERPSIFMQEYAKDFYNSPAWKQCRKAYIKSVGGLCERCYKIGKIVPAEIVHHKVYITPQNINDPNITLAWSNLEALCRDCHGAEHGNIKRYTLDEAGRVIKSNDIPPDSL